MEGRQPLCSDCIKITGKLLKLENIVRTLIDNAPNTYSGTDIEKQQRKMFAFQKAINEAEELLTPEVLKDGQCRMD